jgi:hypothetical protein
MFPHHSIIQPASGWLPRAHMYFFIIIFKATHHAKFNCEKIYTVKNILIPATSPSAAFPTSFLVVLGFELKATHLLGRHSIT